MQGTFIKIPRNFARNFVQANRINFISIHELMSGKFATVTLNFPGAKKNELSTLI